MVLVKCNCMHATEIQWYIVVCYENCRYNNVYVFEQTLLERGGGSTPETHLDPPLNLSSFYRRSLPSLKHKVACSSIAEN